MGKQGHLCGKGETGIVRRLHIRSRRERVREVLRWKSHGWMTGIRIRGSFLVWRQPCSSATAGNGHDPWKGGIHDGVRSGQSRIGLLVGR